jgi:hypothetical protein
MQHYCNLLRCKLIRLCDAICFVKNKDCKESRRWLVLRVMVSEIVAGRLSGGFGLWMRPVGALTLAGLLF